tara:strand:+ start:817 stop:1398 length:582 start_codon:yes stop_codon:yes gene_type:complete
MADNKTNFKVPVPPEINIRDATFSRPAAAPLANLPAEAPPAKKPNPPVAVPVPHTPTTDADTQVPLNKNEIKKLNIALNKIFLEIVFDKDGDNMRKKIQEIDKEIDEFIGEDFNELNNKFNTIFNENLITITSKGMLLNFPQKFEIQNNSNYEDELQKKINQKSEELTILSKKLTEAIKIEKSAKRQNETIQS